MVEERTMLLKKSYFSGISLTKQKILQRRHFISAAIRQGTQAGLLKPYEFLQVQESRPVSFIKFDSAFDPVAKLQARTRICHSAEASLKRPLPRLMRVSSETRPCSVRGIGYL